MENLSLHYKAHGTGEHPHDDLELLRSIYCQNFNKHRFREMDLGLTLTGPHKDDVMIALGAKDARSFASEGQQRSCVMALRLAEWERLRRRSHEAPLMLVDDLGMSLDSSRRKHLLAHFSSLEQVLITTIEESPLIPDEHGITV